MARHGSSTTVIEIIIIQFCLRIEYLTKEPGWVSCSPLREGSFGVPDVAAMAFFNAPSDPGKAWRTWAQSMAQLSEVWSVTSGPWLRPPSTGTDSSVLGCGGGMVGSPRDLSAYQHVQQLSTNGEECTWLRSQKYEHITFLWCLYIYII